MGKSNKENIRFPDSVLDGPIFGSDIVSFFVLVFDPEMISISIFFLENDVICQCNIGGS